MGYGKLFRNSEHRVCEIAAESSCANSVAMY
jgi:hypothetical protein